MFSVIRIRVAKSKVWTQNFEKAELRCFVHVDCILLCLYGLHIIPLYLLQTELLSRMRDQEDIPKEDVSNVQSVLERAAPLQIDAEAVRELMQKIHAMMQKAFLFGAVGDYSETFP
uniref:Uncharacterized protein n=1 Tax=Parascaris equorum TaxID=6256 RepID=A0A914RK97_PAREQ